MMTSSLLMVKLRAHDDIIVIATITIISCALVIVYTIAQVSYHEPHISAIFMVAVGSVNAHPL